MCRRLFFAASSVLAFVVALGFSAAAQRGNSEKKVWDGVFSADQAARGKAAYDLSCSRCHNIALIGSERGPAVKGDAFLANWEKDTVAGLFTKIRDTMPEGNSGTVGDAAKLDILSYILQQNGFPGGADELKADLSLLGDIRFGKKGIWDGVFTAAQADRGKAAVQQGRCNGCHGSDLTGDRAPALTGDRFAGAWENGSVDRLFAKIRDTMPPNNAEQLSAAAKVDIVAYLLQLNGYPAGPTELSVDTNLLDGIQIVKRGADVSGPPNFALALVVGCLAPAPANRWILTSATEPAATKDEAPPPGALQTAAAAALGNQTLELVSIPRSFKPETHAGQKVEVRGLLYRGPGDAALNVTSVETVASSCGR